MIRTYATAEIATMYPMLDSIKRDEETTTDRYTAINTLSAMRQLEVAGFKTYNIKFDVKRKGDKTKGRHMVNMINHDVELTEGNYETAIIMSALDGSKSFQLAYGALRGACFNTCFFGTVEDQLRVIHRGNADIRAIDTVEYMLGQREEKRELVANMRETFVSGADIQLAKAVKEIRPALANVSSRSIMAPRRMADRDNDLYSLYNRAQETLIRGGVRDQHTWRRARTVNSTQSIAKFNREIWKESIEILEAA